MEAPIKILLLESINKKAKEKLTSLGYTVDTEDGSLTEQELISKIADYTVVGIRSKTKITANVLQHAKKLEMVAAFCIGTNQIDIDACTSEGIFVSHAPYSNTRSVVELAIGEIIMLMRDVFTKSTNMHKGSWHKSVGNAKEVRGKTLGIIGYGNIGSQLSVVAEGMGMKVIYHDIQVKLPLGNACSCATIDEVLQQADIVSVHVDGRAENVGMIDKAKIAMMKDGALLINLSRGNVIDIDALNDALRSQKLHGVALDVYPEEPNKGQASFNICLQGADNVIMTPHVGGSTLEAQEDIGEFVSERVADYLRSGSTEISVNLPALKLSDHSQGHRFIHIHNNVPGVLASINDVCSAFNANIVSQQLKTKDAIGYVVTDLNKEVISELHTKLQQISGTIRVRII